MVLGSLVVNVGMDAGGFLGGIAGLLDSIPGIGLELASAIGDALAYSVDQAASLEVATVKLEAVLASTSVRFGQVGQATRMTEQAMLDLATTMSETTRFSREEIVTAEAMAATFTSIGSDTFPQLIQVAADLSTVMGQGLKNSIVQISKALQDPIRGLTALRRVGVQFTEDQETMIKALVKSGDLLGAQKIILQELQVEFGGASQAVGKTFSGSLDILGNKINNFASTIGQYLLPALTLFTQVVGALVDGLAADFTAIMTGDPIGWIGHLLGIDDSGLARLRALFKGAQDFVSGLMDALKAMLGIKSDAGGRKERAFDIADFVGADDASKIKAKAAIDASYAALVDAVVAGARVASDDLKSHPALKRLFEAMNPLDPHNTGMKDRGEAVVQENPLIAFIQKQFGVTPQMIGEVNKIIADVKKAVSPITDLFRNLIIAVFGEQTAGNAHGKGDIGGGGGIVDRVLSALGMSPSEIAQLKTTIDTIMGSIMPGLEKLGSGIAGFFTNIQGANMSKVDASTNAIRDIANALMSAGGIAFGAVLSIVGSALPGIGTGLKQVFDALSKPPTGDTLKDIVTFLSDLGNAVMKIQSSVFDAIANTILSLLGAKGAPVDSFAAIQSVLKGIADWAETAYNNIMKLLGLAGSKTSGSADEFTVGEHGRGRAGFTAGAAPPKAFGGNTLRGSPYLVGERGPELFVPGASGAITSAADLSNMGGGGGGATYNFYGAMTFPGVQDINSMRKALVEETRRLNKT